MPTYQYRCTECANDLEAVQKFTDDALTVCPVCGGQLRKVFNAVGVVFKGSGFYRNDSRGKEPSAASASSNGNGTSKSGDDSGGSSTSFSSSSSSEGGSSSSGGSEKSGSGSEKSGSSAGSGDSSKSGVVALADRPDLPLIGAPVQLNEHNCRLHRERRRDDQRCISVQRGGFVRETRGVAGECRCPAGCFAAGRRRRQHRVAQHLRGPQADAGEQGNNVGDHDATAGRNGRTTTRAICPARGREIRR